jgi:hypothetical protein
MPATEPSRVGRPVDQAVHGELRGQGTERLLHVEREQ